MATKKTLDEEKIHHGHRDRLLETINKVGIHNIPPVNALEFILTYVIPRSDVNPLAHRLLHEFGTISNILDCNYECLASVKGLNTRSAQKLSLLVEIFNYYTESKLNDYSVLKTIGNISDYFETMLRFSTVENIVLVGIDPGAKIIAKKIIAKGSSIAVESSRLNIAEFLATSKAAQLIVAHNHPDGSATPSLQDYATHEKIKEITQVLGVHLADGIIVGNDGVFSIGRKEFLRYFNES